MTEARLPWRPAEVLEVVPETALVKSLVLRVPGWPGHLAGQHVDVRLTAEDGYQAQRSYSIASPPARPELVLTVAAVEDGEVSPYLTAEARPGDVIELRGPIGGYFVYNSARPDPLQLVAAGSGVVPLMAMLRHRALSSPRPPARLLFSSRMWESIIYRDELARLAAADPSLSVTHTLTRSQPPGWTGQRGRVSAAMLVEVAFPPEVRPQVFVCGSTPFVEAVASALVELGHPPERIKTERFGPTGVG